MANNKVTCEMGRVPHVIPPASGGEIRERAGSYYQYAAWAAEWRNLANGVKGSIPSEALTPLPPGTVITIVTG